MISEEQDMEGFLQNLEDYDPNGTWPATDSEHEEVVKAIAYLANKAERDKVTHGDPMAWENMKLMHSLQGRKLKSGSMEQYLNTEHEDIMGDLQSEGREQDDAEARQGKAEAGELHDSEPDDDEDDVPGADLRQRALLTLLKNAELVSKTKDISKQETVYGYKDKEGTLNLTNEPERVEKFLNWNDQLKAKKK